MSFLSRAFSSPLMRGDFYPNEKPAVAIKLEGSKQEQRRLTSIINRIAKSELGKSVLEATAKEGYSLSFQMQLFSHGFCSPSDKIIGLSPTMSDHKLVSTLAHEARHAQQYSGTDLAMEHGAYDVKTEVMLGRSKEADAQAISAAVCYELKNKGDDRPFAYFRSSYSDIAKPFLYISSPKASDEVLQEAFKAWFKDDSMKSSYESAYITGPMQYAMKNNKENELPYTGSMTSDYVLKLLCKCSDGCYFKNNLNALNAPEITDISPETKSVADKFFKVREMRTGKTPDTSYKSLKVRKSAFDVDGLSGNSNAFYAKQLKARRSR